MPLLLRALFLLLSPLPLLFGHVGFFPKLWYPSPSGVGCAFGCLGCSFSEFGNLLAKLRTKHKRWLTWNGHTGSNPMTCGLAIPQSYPWTACCCFVAFCGLVPVLVLFAVKLVMLWVACLFSWTIERSLPVPLTVWLGSPMLGRIGRIELGWSKTFLKHSSLRELKLSERSLTKSHLIRPARMCYFLGLSRVDAPGPTLSGSKLVLILSRQIDCACISSFECRCFWRICACFGFTGCGLWLVCHAFVARDYTMWTYCLDGEHLGERHHQGGDHSPRYCFCLFSL